MRALPPICPGNIASPKSMRSRGQGTVCTTFKVRAVLARARAVVCSCPKITHGMCSCPHRPCFCALPQQNVRLGVTDKQTGGFTNVFNIM